MFHAYHLLAPDWIRGLQGGLACGIFNKDPLPFKVPRLVVQHRSETGYYGLDSSVPSVGECPQLIGGRSRGGEIAVEERTMDFGRQKSVQQQDLFITGQDLPRSDGHVFYAKLNRLLDEAGFDTGIETLCAPY